MKKQMPKAEMTIYQRERRARIKASLPFVPIDPIPNGYKKCTNCFKLKEKSEFSRRSANKSGCQPHCKKCCNIKGEIFRKSALGIGAYSKWRKENITKANAANKRWRDNNPDKVKIYTVRANKKRCSTRGRLLDNIRSAVRLSLKGNKKGKHWETIVGYTVEKLKEHIEKQFSPRMSWENYGREWHIDHKIPISAFNFTSSEDIDFKRCWALSNLRPLDRIENIRKNNKLLRPFQPSLTIEI